MRRKTSRTRVISAVLAVLMILSFGLPAQPGWAAAPKPTPSAPAEILTEKIDPALLKVIKENPAEKVSVIVYMKEQTDFSQAGFASTDSSLTELKAQRDQVYETLLGTAKETQLPVLSLLQGGADGAKALSSDVESFWIFNGVGATVFPDAVNELAALPEVERVYLDEEITIPPDETLSFQGSADEGDFGNWGIEKIRADKVWSELKLDGSGVVVGIMDTGVSREHPALAKKYRGNHTYHVYSFRDFVADKLAPYDDHGHGTHVTGIILGSTGEANNAVGVAPGAEWIAAKALNAHGGALSRAMLRAMQWIQAPEGIASLAPDVINNSWSFPCTNDFFRAAVKSWRAAGIVPVFSAGNAGPGEATVRQPGCFPEVIAVGATDSDDVVTSFSSRGPAFETLTKPDLTAPGLGIRSSIPSKDYDSYSGTSMSTPFVTGVIALMLQANPALSMDQILTTLRSTAVDLGKPGPDNEYGWGRIDAYNAVRASKGNPVGTLKLLSPSGQISQTTPAYEWEPVDNAVRYQLRVRNAADQDVVAAWYRAADSCSAAKCSVQPARTLEKGNYTWQLQVAVGDTVDPWSDAVSFTVDDAPQLAAPILAAPAGEINEVLPVYSWSPLEGATKYLLKVNAAGGAEILSAWYDAGGICTPDQCQVMTTASLEPGKYTWQVQAATDSASGPLSAGMEFSVGAATLAAPAASSPIGEIESGSPEYRWSAVEGALKYQLLVSDASGSEILASWYPSADVCSGSDCAVRTSTDLTPGAYAWQVQAGGETAPGAWSEPLAFQVIDPAAGAPELIAPLGEITETQPSYQWKAASPGAEYKLKLSNDAGKILLATWYTDEPCSSGTCTVTPSLKLAYGDYTWQVQVTSGRIVSPWSDPVSFSVAEPIPGASTPIAPSGTIKEPQPDFVWSAVEGSREYRIKVSGSSGDVLRTWYQSEDVCSAAECRVTPNLTLAAGDYTWQVQTAGDLCGSSWSQEMAFSVEASAPSASLPLQPLGSISETQPTLRWKTVDAAVEYHVKISALDGQIVYDKWFRTPDFCKGGICTARISNSLTGGEYTWQVQASGAAGEGAWSDALNFSILTLPPAAPQALAPSGDLGGSQPVFQWAVQPGALGYEIRLDSADGKAVLLESYQAEDVCSSTLCSLKASHSLAVGSYVWKVRGSNASGSGVWSGPMAFVLNAPPSPTAPPADGDNPALPHTYTVKTGDSLALLARDWGVALEELAQMNNIAYPYILRAGQVIVVPDGQSAAVVPASRSYTVKSGDHLMALAREWNQPWEEIVRLNDLKVPYSLQPGDVLIRP